MPPRHAAGVPEGGSHLERYASRFNAVEINSSFHRPHRHTTYQRWSDLTPAAFRFSVKLPKTITHEARLADCNALLDPFAGEIAGLGDKLAVLLVQLPPSLAFERDVAARFLDALHACLPTQVALEPRHASWFAPEVDHWLVERKIARVAADPPPVPGAGRPGGWAGFVYYRLHGSPRMYYSTYDGAALASLARSLERSVGADVPTWCIFDNTAAGAAFGNALALKASLQRR